MSLSSGFRFTGAINWFPGHMHKAASEMKAGLRKFDAVLEVRDARLPWSSAPTSLLESDLYRDKRRIVIFNKVDLAPRWIQSELKKQFATHKNLLPFFCDGRKPQSLKQLVPLALKLISSQESEGVSLSAQNLMRGVKAKKTMNLIVAGLPNVGKSTIINSISQLSDSGKGKKRKVEVGDRPGVTRRVSKALKVHDDPLTFLVDTPGIMIPKIVDSDHGLKLALIDCIKSTRVPQEVLFDFLFHLLNQINPQTYMSFLGLSTSIESSSDLVKLVANQFFPQSKNFNASESQNSHVCSDEVDSFQINSLEEKEDKHLWDGDEEECDWKMKNSKNSQSIETLQFQKARTFFLKKFREGELGTFLLDDIHSPSNKHF